MPDRQQLTAFQAAWEAAKERARAQGRVLHLASEEPQDQVKPQLTPGEYIVPRAVFRAPPELPEAADEDAG